MSDGVGSTGNQALIEELTAFGISNIEAKIYLHLVNKPPKSIIQTAQDLELPRTSVYDNAVRLAEKGLIQRFTKQRSPKLQALSLGVLQDYIDKERARVKIMQDRLAVLEENVRQVTLPPQQTQVRYYRGVQAFKQMILGTLKAKKETFGYSQLGNYEAAGDPFYANKIEEFIRRGLKDRVIVSTSTETIECLTTGPYSKYRPLYQEARVLDPENFQVQGDITIYNDIFQVTYWKHGEVIGVEIENAELVKTQKSIFETLWAQAEPLEDYLARVGKT